jgi:hypothetical protein
MFGVNAVHYDPFGTWTSLKMILTPLNGNRYDFLNANGVTLNDLHCPTIRCPLNVN